MATNLFEWATGKGHVDDDVLVGNQDYVSGESVVIAAGPPNIQNAGPEVWGFLSPIGVIQNVGIAQSRQLQQLFEIGSRESYFIPGKTFVNATFSRVLVHGPSLLKAFYKGWINPDISDTGTVDEVPPVISQDEELPGNPYIGNPGGDGTDALMYINLSSEFFNRPIGLLLLMQDVEKDNYAAIYLENCHIQSHQISISAQQTLIMENLQLRCSKVVPLDVGTGVA